LVERTTLSLGDGFAFEPPPGPGLILVNPPYDARLRSQPEQWRRLGDLFKQRYRGWRAVVLAGDPDRGKHIGLRPSFRLPVRNGPLDARILGFEIY
jgi:putative N6-adenine-specific DNA methylase